MRKNRLLLWVIIGGGVATAVVFAPPEHSAAPEIARPKAKEPRAGAPAAGRFAALPERETLGRPRTDIFGSVSPPAAVAKPVAAPIQAAPAAPPMPYRVAGRVVRGGEAEVVLAKGDAVLAARVGDTLDGGYRVEAIEPDRVTLVYLPLDARHSLPVVSTLGPDAPSTVAAQAMPSKSEPAAQAAQLRWEGPREVRAGNTFDVALRVTSAQPLRSSPLQLSYDAKLLEPVEVRAGGFFAGGMFSYRVNPAGSIFVGASGKGAAAADAEILIVTFRPILAGATAELKLSSVMLQSAAGRTIALDQPVAFRTAIAQ